MKRLIPALIALMLASMPGPLFAADFGGGVGVADGGKAACVDIDQDGTCEVDGTANTNVTIDADDDGNVDYTFTRDILTVGDSASTTGQIFIDSSASGSAFVNVQDNGVAKFAWGYFDTDDDWKLQRFDAGSKDVFGVDHTSGNIILGDGIEGTWTWDGATGDVVLNAAGSVAAGGVGGGDVSALRAVSSSPGIEIRETGAAADEKSWDSLANSGGLLLRAVNDANSAATTWLQVDRTGITIDTVAFVNGDVDMQSTTNSGSITLSVGTGTATTFTGAVCVCTDTTANLNVQCAVSGTTLTATGTASDVIAYACF